MQYIKIETLDKIRTLSKEELEKELHVYKMKIRNWGNYWWGEWEGRYNLFFKEMEIVIDYIKLCLEEK